MSTFRSLHSDASSFDGWPSLMAYVVQHPWHHLTMHRMAEHVGMTLDQFQAFFPDKASILESFIRYVDAMSWPDQKIDHTVPLKDRLFEAIMTRLDHLTPYRPWVTSFLSVGRCQPCEHQRLGKQWLKSVALLCRNAGMNTKGVHGWASVATMVGVYLYTLRHWTHDLEPGLGSTMATLDQGLSFLEGWLEDA